MDDRDLTAAFEAHKQTAPLGEHGKRMFTRRIAITLADMADISVKSLVHRCERLGLCKPGAWNWFRQNGGFTKEHFEQTRNERRSI